MFNNDVDILKDLTGECNLADAFNYLYNKKVDFNKLDYMKNGATKKGLSLSKDVYAELEARLDFQFIVTQKKKK